MHLRLGRGLAVSLAIILSAHAAHAAFEPSGMLDPTFNAGIITDGQVTAFAEQPDGKLVVAGTFGKANGVSRHNIARFNTDGSLDMTFGAGSVSSGPDTGPAGILIQGDGKLIIYGGFFFSVDGVAREANIARLNTDGSLDTTFDPGRTISFDGSFDGSGGTAVKGNVSSAVIQNGKLVVTGTFFHVITGTATSVPRAGIARFELDATGSFDPTFNPGSGMVQSTLPSGSFGISVVRQSDDKLVVAGLFDSYNGNPAAGLARLEVDGAFDATFNPGTATDPRSIIGLFMQADDRVVAFGSFTSWAGMPRTHMVRLLNTGAIDGGFVPPLFKEFENAITTVSSVAQQTDGRLIVGGVFHSIDGLPAKAIARLLSDGSLDTSFAVTSAAGLGRVSCVAVRPSDGRIFVGGYFSSYGGVLRNNVALANTDGTTATAFAPQGVTDSRPQINAIVTLPDGKILVGGVFTAVNGTPRYNFARLNSDGSLDDTFAVTMGTGRSVRAILIQPDGKILIAGNFSVIDNTPISHIARLNPDGTLDPTFDPGMGASETIHAMAQDSAGNIYIGGGFLSVSGVSRPYLAKLTPSGALDMTFNPGVGPNNLVRAIVAADDGGVVLGGSFTQYNGVMAGRIARVDAVTAVRDAGFAPGAAFIAGGTGVRSMLLLSDGGYLVGGNFSGFNGVMQRGLIRLKSDGTRDASFAPSPTFAGTGSVFALTLQGSKIIAGGSFASPGVGVVRLSATGAQDSTFNTGTGPRVSAASPFSSLFTEVDVLRLQPDGKLLIGGIFNEYQGTTRYCLVRVTGPELRIDSIVRAPGGEATITGAFFGTPNTLLALDASADLTFDLSDAVVNATTSGTGFVSFTDFGAIGQQQRFYRIRLP